jgi:hypothetical protein
MTHFGSETIPLSCLVILVAEILSQVPSTEHIRLGDDLKTERDVLGILSSILVRHTTLNPTPAQRSAVRLVIWEVIQALPERKEEFDELLLR